MLVREMRRICKLEGSGFAGCIVCVLIDAGSSLVTFAGWMALVGLLLARLVLPAGSFLAGGAPFALGVLFGC